MNAKCECPGGTIAPNGRCETCGVEGPRYRSPLAAVPEMPPWPDPEGREADKPVRRMVLTPASEIQPEPVVWAWEDDGYGRVPAGSMGLAAGREGTGKSSFAIWMSAKVTRGELPGSFMGTPRSVIYVAVEDSWKYTIVPRLMAAGADTTRVFRAEVQTVEDETVSLSLPADNRMLEAAIGDNGVAMVVLDPLMSAIGDSLDTHVNRQVRQALDPLARIADRTGAIMLGIAHFSKATGTDVSSLITGSGAFKDVARFIFGFATDEESETGGGVITQSKNSLGRSGLPSLAYRIVEATVPTAKGDARVGRFVLDGASERSVTDILLAGQGGDDRNEKSRAEEVLRDLLADGPKRSKEVEEDAREVYGISVRTLKRARSELRVPAAKRNSGRVSSNGQRAAEWWISLPQHEGDLREPYDEPEGPPPGGKSAKDSNPPRGGTLGTLGTLGDLSDSGADLKSAKGTGPRVPAENALTSQECNSAKNSTPIRGGTLPGTADGWPEDTAGAEANPRPAA